MPAISLTAPRISLEEENLEQRKLSKEEINYINSDVYGVNNKKCCCTQHKDFEEHMRLQMRMAIAQLPDSNKQAYREALNISPHLIETESNPVAFLRCEDFDVMASANRLVQYWEFRRDLFGNERAYQPMKLDSIVTSQISSRVQRNAIQIIQEDSRGRAVLFYDTKLASHTISKNKDRTALLRWMFYLLHNLIQQEQYQHNGYIFLENVQHYDAYRHYDRPLIRSMYKLMKVIPLRLRATHFCCGSGRSMFHLVLPTIKYLMDKNMRLRTMYHEGSKKDLLAILKGYGIVGKNVEDAL